MTAPHQPQPPPQAWVDALDRARTDVLAGRTHDFEDVMQQLEAEDAAALQHGISLAE